MKPGKYRCILKNHSGRLLVLGLLLLAAAAYLAFEWVDQRVANRTPMSESAPAYNVPAPDNI